MKKWCGELNMNTMLKIVAGKRYTGGVEGEDEEEMMSCREVIREWFQYLGKFLVADALPFLDWLDLGGYEKTMKRVARELDSMFGKWLEEHRQKRSSGNATKVNDFIDVMIQVVEDDDLAGYNVDTIIKAMCESLIAGGADTSTVMLTWALSLLLNNRYALIKAQEELDTQVGKDRQVNESDIKNLVYLQAVVKETLRLYLATFLGGPRAFTKDCTVAGYHVSKGTWLLTNTWKLHCDPKLWSDPCEFRPERFLTFDQKGLDVKVMDFEFIPFGAGRRSCPGIRLADQMLHSVLATFLQNFEISTPNGEPVDMTAIAGLTNAKESPLEDFFIVLHEIFAKRVEVSDIHCVKDAKVPLMMFKFEGISVDLPYAQLQVTTVPENVDILNPLFLNGIDETSWKSLSGVRANNSILQLVPDVKVLA
ncbi:hypothetical protein L1987_30498 [Smallanthus sonchifolius]|uniref:Uncharacterized protein n=1 Tax=Smallanthus sonchifolius TaxID=185202 RepID=A0ACB9I4A8_9ASTR|nr:hypothetical protein L1987_30498 [Smallanthus sonchifolius]